MKNIFRILMAVAVLFTASCAKEDISSTIAGGEANVTFTVDLPELGTRAENFGKGASATTLRYYVYDGNNYLPAISSESLPNEKVTLNGGKATVTLPLIKGMTYNIVFWADNGSNIYAINPETKVLTVNYTNAKANDDSRDAFYKYVPAIDPATATNEDTTIVLTRPFAQLNAATNDLTAVKNSGVVLSSLTSKVTVKNAYTTLNLVDGTVDNPTQVTFDAAVIPANKDPKEVLKADYEYLSMNYVLVNTKELVEATLTVYGERSTGGEAFPLTVNNYTNVPLQRNYRTNIFGSLITKATDFEVTIDPAFGIPDIDEWEQVADGVTRHNNDYYLTNAAGLFWLAGEVNKYDNYQHPFEGKTVYLTTDIDLQDAEWTPIGDYRFSANRFCGTFDGQNHTISNFKISKDTEKNDAKKSSYGFFGNVEGTIKNLTIDNASVTAYAYTAILVGRLTNGTLENCHVKNSSVVNNYWQAGGLVGQQNDVCNIKNCSVDNVTVQAKSCVGLLVGPMTNGEKDPATVSTIENCSVKNSQIIQRGSHGSSYDKMFGVINPDVEFSNNTLNINNFTSENNSFDRNGVNADLALYAGLEGNVFIDGVCVSAYGLTIVDGYTALFRDNAGDYCLLNKQSLIDWHAFLAKDTTRNPYNCNVKMLADIDANGWTWNSLWITPAAGNLTGLQFDGQNHTIFNLKIAGEGMFSASLAGMAFKNLTIDGVNVASTGHNAAVFAGAAYSSVSFENVAVKNANVNGPCNTGIFVGGTNEPNNLVIRFKDCSVETSSVTAVGYNYQDPTGASGFVGKAYGSTKLVFEGTNAIDDATTITNLNGLVGGKAYGYTVYANGGWAGTGASDELVSWGGLSYVSDAAALTEALKNGGTVVLSQDVVAEAATTAPYGNKYGFKLDGGVLDGNDHELKVECYGDDYGIMTSGGTVKNLTIKEGCRAIMIMSPTEDIILDNVNFGGDGVLYPINTGEAGAEGIKLVVTDSTLAGWVSFSNIASASFTNVEFKQGTYYNNIYGRVLKPYVSTTITGCSFVAHMNLDLSKLPSGHKITFKNCTVDGQAINAGVFTVPTTDAQYDTELFTVDLPSWASSINDCIVFE